MIEHRLKVGRGRWLLTEFPTTERRDTDER